MTYKLILASQSPRRRQMVTWLNLPVTTTVADIDENPLPGETPKILAGRLAEEKALKVRESYKQNWILAADTIVDREELILGKPRSAAHATELLKNLRAAEHQVHTAVSLLGPGIVQPATVIVTTDVWMRPYSDEEIAVYVASGDPLDKAGAYAVQHQGFHPVQRLNRCYANVVGLPLCALLRLLKEQFTMLSVNPYQLCQQHFGYRCPGKDEGTQL